MEEAKCPFHELHEQRLNDFSKRISQLETKTALDNQKFTMILENLSELPCAIKSMEKSMCSMQKEIESSNKKSDSMKEQLEKINAKVNQIDNEGKLNIRQYIKDHAVWLIVSATIIAALITAWIGNLANSIF